MKKVLNLDTLQTIEPIIAHWASVLAEAPAQVFGDRVTTYRILHELSNRVASALIAEGAKPGTRIAVLAKNGDYQFELLFGAAKSRTTLVPINWRLASCEIAHILNDSEAAFVFVESQFLELFQKAEPALHTVPAVIVLGGALQKSYATWRDSATSAECFPHGDGSDDVLQLYTSGTTGHPKGVVLTHSNLLAMLSQAIAAGWGAWCSSVRQLVCMPLFHVGGISPALIGLSQGCTNIILPDANVTEILNAALRHQIQTVFLVPSVLNALLKELLTAKCDLSSLDLILYGASPIAEALLVSLQNVLPCKFVQLYGMTELSGAVTYLPPEDHCPTRGKLRSCGVPNPSVAIKVANDSWQSLAAFSLGEICVSSSSVMKGYWKNSGATAEVLQDGWLRTGDIGYLDDEGYLFIHDRAKDMVISGGENIYPVEVENAIAAHPMVDEVAVIGVPNEKWGESTKALVVLKENGRLTLEDLVLFLRNRIAGYKIPKSLECVPALPRTSSGKIMKRQLREAYWSRTGRGIN
jgi:acyl-CoA synthetase (AMP-forming)/AMP-acid ligase II